MQNNSNITKIQIDNKIINFNIIDHDPKSELQNTLKSEMPNCNKTFFLIFVYIDENNKIKILHDMQNTFDIAEFIIPEIYTLHKNGQYCLMSQKGSNNTSYNFLIVSLGAKDKFFKQTIKNYLTTLRTLANIINEQNIINLNLSLDLYLDQELIKILQLPTIIEDNATSNKDNEIKYIEYTLFHLCNFMYSFKTLKTNNNSDVNVNSKNHIHDAQTNKSLEHLNINIYNNQYQKSNSNEEYNLLTALYNAKALIDGAFIIKNLANTPANLMTPFYLSKAAEDMVKSLKNHVRNDISIEILDKEAISKLGMNTFLAVAQGSVNEAKFIKMYYNGNKNNTQPVVLIGKGISFDSGGLSLKPAESMETMKFDMSGAATVIGIFNTVSQLNLAINLVCLIPTCENMPSGSAVKPGDVIKTMAGTTVEILNTDAEGRLILCDALHYAKEFNPALVIDIATLTGACRVALGNIASALFSNHQDTAELLLKSANKTGDKTWQMPLYEEAHEMLTSDVADIANIANVKGSAGSIVAACFLEKFVDYKWAHIDIASIAYGNSIYNANSYKLATARPFYMLIDFLRNNYKS